MTVNEEAEAGFESLKAFGKSGFATDEEVRCMVEILRGMSMAVLESLAECCRKNINFDDDGDITLTISILVVNEIFDRLADGVPTTLEAD